MSRRPNKELRNDIRELLKEGKAQYEIVIELSKKFGKQVSKQLVNYYVKTMRPT